MASLTAVVVDVWRLVLLEPRAQSRTLRLVVRRMVDEPNASLDKGEEAFDPLRTP
jgi:hypothetical protein